MLPLQNAPGESFKTFLPDCSSCACLIPHRGGLVVAGVTSARLWDCMPARSRTEWPMRRCGRRAQGCIELLDRSGIKIAGARAVVIGRSNIVGMPVALLLLRRDATVTIVHSKTQKPEEIVREADIVIAAAGQAEFVRGDWIKPGAAVIDVGTNPVDVRSVIVCFSAPSRPPCSPSFLGCLCQRFRRAFQPSLPCPLANKGEEGVG